MNAIYLPPVNMALIYDKGATALVRPLSRQPRYDPKTKTYSWQYGRRHAYEGLTKAQMSLVIGQHAPWTPGQTYHICEPFFLLDNGRVIYRLDHPRTQNVAWMPAKLMMEEWMARGWLEMQEVCGRQLQTFTPEEVEQQMKFHNIWRFVEYALTNYTGMAKFVRNFRFMPKSWLYYLRFTPKMRLSTPGRFARRMAERAALEGEERDQ